MTSIQAPVRLSEKELLRLLEQPGVEYDGNQAVEKPMSLRSGEVEITVGSLFRVEAGRTGEARVFSFTSEQALPGFRCAVGRFFEQPA